MNCTIYYNKKTTTHHLWQIFSGFFELKAKGCINLKFVEKDLLPDTYTDNLLIVDIDGQCRILYDVNDGFNWIWGDKEANLKFFRETLSVEADFYFKRSYNSELQQYSRKSKVYPLGFNYPVTSPVNKMAGVHFDIKSRFKHYLRSSKIVPKLLKVDSIKEYYIPKFENAPISSNAVPKTLFITRLWDPGTIQADKIADAVHLNNNRQEISEMNEIRVKSIIECKKLFGKQFNGGLTESPYARQRCPELIVPFKVSNKESYLNLVKDSDICIATTGLNKSVGWKFGEYVAAARAVISEKIHYTVPGKFSINENYLEFNDVKELVKNIRTLTENPDMLSKMMLNNYQYYQLYLKPENLVLNTLITAIGKNRKEINFPSKLEAQLDKV